jgi:hypothetical protein
MTELQWWIGAVSVLITAVLLAGLVVRRRYRSCYTFSVYLVTVLAADTLILLWPEIFHRWAFWILKENVHSLLKFAIALELALRTLQGFPGARATARAVVLLVLLVALGGMLAEPLDPRLELYDLASRLHPRILNTAIWLFTAVAVVILWYRLPVDAFHKAILLGFVPYLLVFTVAINALASVGSRLQVLVGYVHPIAYLLVLVYWTYAAWRPQEAPFRAAPTAQRAVQPIRPPA